MDVREVTGLLVHASHLHNTPSLIGYQPNKELQRETIRSLLRVGAGGSLRH
jgi:hypothetical protein